MIQMSHCTVTWSFADQTSPGTDTEVYIDEITNEDLNYPAQTSKMVSFAYFLSTASLPVYYITSCLLPHFLLTTSLPVYYLTSCLLAH